MQNLHAIASVAIYTNPYQGLKRLMPNTSYQSKCGNLYESLSGIETILIMGTTPVLSGNLYESLSGIETALQGHFYLVCEKWQFIRIPIRD